MRKTFMGLMVMAFIFTFVFSSMSYAAVVVKQAPAIITKAAPVVVVKAAPVVAVKTAPVVVKPKPIVKESKVVTVTNSSIKPATSIFINEIKKLIK